MVRSTKESWLHSRPGQQVFSVLQRPTWCTRKWVSKVLSQAAKRLGRETTQQISWNVKNEYSYTNTPPPPICLRGMHTDNIIFKLFISYQLNAQNFFIHIMLNSSTCFEQYYAIIRRSNCMYTSYGIVILYEWTW
jgi:hypothetical protein